MRSQVFVTVARWFFGVFYAAVGVLVAFSVLGFASPPVQPTASAAAFTSALTASGIIDPLLALSYLVGGAALLFRRTAPLGIVLLAPSVVVIFFFHLYLSGQWVWGSINLLWLGGLAWYFRDAYKPLWNSPSAGV